MTEQNFDRLLKEVLDNLAPEYDPTTWALFRQRMEERSGDVQPVDEGAWLTEVRQKLAHLSAPYEESSWQHLRERMRLYARRKAYVYVAKGLEAALLLLLLWFFCDNSFFLTPSHRPDMSPPEHFTPPIVGGGRASATLPTKPHEDRAFAVGVNERVSAAYASSEAPLHSEEVDVLHGRPLSEQTPSSTALEAMASLPELPPPVLPAPVSRQVKQAEMFPWPSSFLTPKPSEPKRFHLLWAFSAQQYRLADSPAAAREAITPGFSLRVARRKGPWAFEGGVEYAEVTFALSGRERIYGGTPQTGYRAVRLSRMYADVLSLPLGVSRRLMGSDQWEVWLVAGAAAHFALQKGYDYDHTYYPPGSLPLMQPDTSAQPYLLAKGRGLLEGGALSSNAFLTGEVGMRWEYASKDGSRAGFVQPAYRRAISAGIDLEGKSLQTWSLQVGMRIALSPSK